MMTKIKRAVISVYDKKGVVGLARFLHQNGVEIISTGGTAELLKKSRIPVKQVASVTGFPEMLDGRVKTLHPRIHAGLLAVRDNPQHAKALVKQRIQPIDLLVINLYPFWDAMRTQSDPAQIIEMIDIGGPAMLRSAAKNHRFVAAVSDPRDYGLILRELKKNNLQLTEKTRQDLAVKVFKLTSYYDGLIRRYLEGRTEEKNALPDHLTLDFEKLIDLRYGENPHQKGALYIEKGGRSTGVVKAKKWHGKELSFNNILDLDAALEMVATFNEPACSIIKHTSPCGFAVGSDATSAFRSAYACDPLSAFGSIVGLNVTVDEKCAKQILKSGFIECIIAKGFTERALRLLKVKKNLRLLSVPIEKRNGVKSTRLDFKKVEGGLLLQERDTQDPGPSSLKCVTKKSPKPSQIKDLLFAFKVCRYVKSNAIVVAKNSMTVGLGMGQPSRVDSCQTALRKAGRRARGAVMASDGFFPKPDSIQLAKKAGVSAMIQPGGSIQDEAVIKACNAAGISMVFTGIRHFKH